MSKKLNEHIVGQFSKEYLNRIPHHVAPSLNLHSSFPTSNAATVSNLLLNEFPYPVTLPTPMTPLARTSSLVLSGIDPVTSLVIRKIKWELRKEKLLKSIRADRGRKIGRAEKRVQRAKAGGTVSMPRGVAMLARHLDSDPDPAFSGVYNWYYTGGTLASLELNQDRYLLYSSPINGEIKICKAQEERFGSFPAISLNYNQPVHQIVANSKGAAVRQQNRVHILTPGEAENGSLLTKVQCVPSKKDNFVSVALRSSCVEQFCTLNAKGTLRLWDAETCKKRTKVRCKKGAYLGDCWGSLLFQDDNTLLHTDRCCIHIYDIRAGLTRQTSWCPSSMLEPCQQLSLLVPSQQSPDHTLYAATSHQLLLLDCRSGFRQCWTHLMAAPPYLGCAHLIENNAEVVCLGSQVMTECVAVVNNWSGDENGEGDESRSTCLPRLLPSPSSALLQTRRRGLSLHPSLTTRCTMSLTGLAAVPSNEGLRVFRQSASGDVFAQVVARTAERDSVNAYKDWSCSTTTLEPQPTTVNVTRTEDLRPLLSVLTLEDPLPYRPAQKSRARSAWKVSKKYLEDCVDLMAEKILKVWEIEEEDEWLEEVEDIGEEDPGERVLNWLGTTEEPAPYIAMANANNMLDVSADDVVKNSTEENAEMYPSTSNQFADPIKTEPEFHMTSSTWDFPLTQQVKRMHPSPTPSEEDMTQMEKKCKTFDESFMSPKPVKSPISTKKTVSSVKKKFVPGF